MPVDWEAIYQYPDEGISEHFPAWEIFQRHYLLNTWEDVTRRYVEDYDYYVHGRRPVEEFFGEFIELGYSDDEGIGGLDQDYTLEPIHEPTIEDVRDQLLTELLEEIDDHPDEEEDLAAILRNPEYYPEGWVERDMEVDAEPNEDPDDEMPDLED